VRHGPAARKREQGFALVIVLAYLLLLSLFATAFLRTVRMNMADAFNGEAQIEYHVPVPAGLKDLRLRAAIGIRDGGQGDDRLVAFRVRVDGWQVWSRAVYPRTWQPFEVKLPFQAGNVLRLTLATDGLGEHSWAWAVWADPELTGELAE